MYIPAWSRLSSAATLRLRGRRDLPGDMSHLHFTFWYLDQNMKLKQKKDLEEVLFNFRRIMCHVEV